MTEPDPQPNHVRHAGPFRIEVFPGEQHLMIYDQWLGTWTNGSLSGPRDTDSIMKSLAKALAYLDGTFDVIGNGH